MPICTNLSRPTPDNVEDENRRRVIGVRRFPGLAPDFRCAGRFSKTAPGGNADLSPGAFLETAAGFRVWQHASGFNARETGASLLPGILRHVSKGNSPPTTNIALEIFDDACPTRVLP